MFSQPTQIYITDKELESSQRIISKHNSTRQQIVEKMFLCKATEKEVNFETELSNKLSEKFSD